MTRNESDTGTGEALARVIVEEQNTQLPGGWCTVYAARLLVAQGYGDARFEDVGADYTTVWKLPDGRPVTISTEAANAHAFMAGQTKALVADAKHLLAAVREGRYIQVLGTLARIGLCLPQMADGQALIQAALEAPDPDAE